MIAVDTNILVYAHRPDLRDHSAASAALESLSNGRSWGIPWPVAHEFVRVVTDRRRFKDPTPLTLAVNAVAAPLEAGAAVALGENKRHWSRLSELALAADASGTLVYDARIAAICLEEGVSELWTADRDFGRFPALRTRNPLIASA